MQTFLGRLSAMAMFWLSAMDLAEAQVDPRLLEDPWRDEDHWADTRDKPIYILRSDLEGEDEDLQVIHWDSHGRVKFDRADREPTFWVGYRILTVDVQSDLDFFDHTFADLALAGAARLGSLWEGWTVSVAAGAGTANDGRFDNSHALYPVATLEVSEDSDLRSRWHFGLSLDGSRALLPLIPLPYARIDLEVGPGLEARLGTLESELRWKPVEELTAILHWSYPTDAFARVEWSVGGEFQLFAEVSRRIDGFHLRHRNRTRVFYELNSVEAGARWTASWIDVSLSAGFAFEQEFFTGTDLRDHDHAASPENGPLVALTIQGTF